MVKAMSEDRHIAKIKEEGSKISEDIDYDISELAHYVFVNYTEFSPQHFLELIKL